MRKNHQPLRKIRKTNILCHLSKVPSKVLSKSVIYVLSKCYLKCYPKLLSIQKCYPKVLSKVLSKVPYYAIYPNRHIKAAEQANIPKFSKLDDIGTCLRLFESFFDDTLVDVIVGYTKLYDQRQKRDASFVRS